MGIWDRLKEARGLTSSVPRPTGIGGDMLRRVDEHLQIDRKWSVDGPDGFTWWAHQQAQRVWTTPSKVVDGNEVARVISVTEVARGAPDTQAVREALAVMNADTGFSAAYRTPDGKINLVASVIVHAQNIEWLHQVFSLACSLQLFAASYYAKQFSDALGIKPARSKHPISGSRAKPDAMVEGGLRAAGDYVRGMQAGGQTVPFADPERYFSRLAAMLGGAGLHANGGATGLTVEVPFGTDSTLIQAFVEAEHAYGLGVVVTTMLPIAQVVETPGYEDPLPFWQYRNLTASSAELDDTSQHELGGWLPNPVAANSTVRLMFIPAIVAREGIVDNLLIDACANAKRLGDAWASVE